MKSYGVTIQMKAIEQYFPVLLFTMIFQVVLTFDSLDEILMCDNSNETWRLIFLGEVLGSKERHALSCLNCIRE